MPKLKMGKSPGSDLGKGLGDLGGGLGGGGIKKIFNKILIFASIGGILSAIGIFIQILSIDPGFNIPFSVQNLGIIAGVCALITGLDTLWNTFKGQGGI